MLSDDQVQSICRTIQQKYTACDVSDALLKLKVPAAGAVVDIGPITGNNCHKPRIVAPVSTVLYASKGDLDSGSGEFAAETNIPHDQHWTEYSTPGTVVVIQQPRGQTCAVIGDIIATRLKLRGIHGIVAGGRIRDVQSCAALCQRNGFQIWSEGFSAAAPSLETKPWMIDVALQLGKVRVSPGDIICLDEGDMAIVVIPRELLKPVSALLEILKKASNGVQADVENGMTAKQATSRHPDFYSNYK